MQRKEILRQFRMHVTQTISKISIEYKKTNGKYEKTGKKILSIPDKKFLLQIIECIYTLKEVNLSKFADLLNEKINKLSTVCRLSEHLKSFTFEKLELSIAQWLKKYLPKDELLLAIDKSDYINKHQQKAEDITYIPNGSEHYDKSKKGYINENILAYTKYNKPVILKTEMTNKTQSNSKKDEYVCLEFVDTIYSDYKKTYLGDSAYDNQYMINYMVQNNNKFIFNMDKDKGQRQIIYNGQKTTISKILNQLNIDYLETQSTYHGEKCFIKIRYIKAVYPTLKDLPLTFICIDVDNGKQFVLVTNKDCNSLNDALSIYKTYQKRWEIEMMFQTVKSDYHLESTNIRKYKSISNLYKIIMLMLTIISTLATPKTQNLFYSLFELAKGIRNNIIFELRRIAIGIENALSKNKTRFTKSIS